MLFASTQAFSRNSAALVRSLLTARGMVSGGPVAVLTVCHHQPTASAPHGPAVATSGVTAAPAAAGAGAGPPATAAAGRLCARRCAAVRDSPGSGDQVRGTEIPPPPPHSKHTVRRGSAHPGPQPGRVAPGAGSSPSLGAARALGGARRAERPQSCGFAAVPRPASRGRRAGAGGGFSPVQAGAAVLSSGLGGTRPPVWLGPWDFSATLLVLATHLWGPPFPGGCPRGSVRFFSPLRVCSHF